MFEKDYSLAAKTASKEDENCTGLKSRTGFSWLDGFANLCVQI